jgi:hypothetical protein
MYKAKEKWRIGSNLRTQKRIILLKHLDKFYNKVDIPWVTLIWSTYYSDGEVPHTSKDKGSFWWRDVLRLVDWFRGIATCKIGDGTTVLFWKDICNDHLLQ